MMVGSCVASIPERYHLCNKLSFLDRHSTLESTTDTAANLTERSTGTTFGTT